ncbi:MAG: sterol desaturase family protein [Ktedonobacteraceae bacterium]|nr:sterol desaturase family protein [Ktedonobacteraceae bacterium]
MALFFEGLRNIPLEHAILYSLLVNIALFLATLVAGHFLVQCYHDRPTTSPPAPISCQELLLACSSVVWNALITILGFVLWRAHIIVLRMDLDWRVLSDTVILLLSMDFAMYVFHRIAHHPWFYPWIHMTHHRYENPRPLSLFVLNPFEVLGFGLLWLVILVLSHVSWLGALIYLVMNLLFGLCGHLGVEPFPRAWLTIPLLRTISTSTFHTEHHLDQHHNFGFYTLLWDHLFGTLSPNYQHDFRATFQQERNHRDLV